MKTQLKNCYVDRQDKRTSLTEAVRIEGLRLPWLPVIHLRVFIFIVFIIICGVCRSKWAGGRVCDVRHRGERVGHIQLLLYIEILTVNVHTETPVIFMRTTQKNNPRIDPLNVKLQHVCSENMHYFTFNSGPYNYLKI